MEMDRDFADALASFLDPADGFAGQLPFFCDREICSGDPHDGRPWDRGDDYRPDFGYNHARAPQQRQVVSSDLFRYIALFLAGRGTGKALDVATLIPTPDGWSKMGDLQVGDYIFDETGAQTQVTAVYDQGALDGWELTFSDHTTLVACDEHLWVTVDALERKRRNRRGAGLTGWAKSKPITTADLVRTQLTPTRRPDRNHAIPLAGELDTPERVFGLDPYLLGLWLGDGSKSGAIITCHPDDEACYKTAAESVGEGWWSRPTKHGILYAGLGTRPQIRDALGRNTDNGSFHSRLRRAGLLFNKHIPAAYMRGSARQRRALLAGLMDSDGYASGRKNTVEFSSTQRVLADGVLELARSLGEKPVMAEGRAMLYGRDCGPKFRVTWRPHFAPFTLPRKAALCGVQRAQAMRADHRMIVGAERVTGVSMRCITVDSPNALYLAGEGMIPTHNTRVGAEWLVDSMYEARPDTFWGVVAPTFDDARDICVKGESGMLAVLDRRKIPYVFNMNLGILTLPHNNAVCEIFADSNPERLRGPNLSGAWLDEPGSMRNAIGTSSAPGTWDNLKLMARIGTPKIMVTGTPKPTRFITMLRDKAGLIIRGSSDDNRKNLADVWYDEVILPLKGTSLGRQEVDGEILEAIDGALWKRDWIKVATHPVPLMRTIRIGWDPAITSHAKSDAHGVVVAGIALNGDVWVLADFSAIMTPLAAAIVVLKACVEFNVSLVAIEPNQGGDVWHTLLLQAAKELGYPQSAVPKTKKSQSTHSKEARAQPVAFRYESNFYTVWHTPGLDDLEIEMCTWVPKDSKDSPNRLDALVLAFDSLGTITGTASAGSMSAAAAAGGGRRLSRKGSVSAAMASRAGRGRFTSASQRRSR